MVGHKPARGHKDPIVGQPLQVEAEGLAGVEVVLGQGEGACGGGRPGVHEGQHNGVVAAGAAGDEAAAVVDHGHHTWLLVGAAAELTEDGVGRLDDEGVQFDRRHLALAQGQGGGDITAPARADDEGVPAGPQEVGQTPNIGLPEGSVEGSGPEDIGAGVGVDSQDQPVGQFAGEDGDAREGVPALVERPAGLGVALDVAQSHQPGRHRERQSPQHQGQSSQPQQPAPETVAGRQDHSGQGQDDAGGQHQTGAPQALHQRHEGQTGQASPQQVAGVEAAGVGRPLGQQSRDSQPDADEGDEKDEGGGRHRQRIARLGGQAGDEPIPEVPQTEEDDDGQDGAQSAQTGQEGQAGWREAVGPEADDDPAGCQAQ